MLHMSSFPQVQKIIQEITDDLYPGIELLFHKVSTYKKNETDTESLEKAFDIFEVLKEEIHSLKKYELKLVFPGIKTLFDEMGAAIPHNIRINELHDLLKKKEECVRNKILDLEVELEDTLVNPLGETINFFKDNYFCKKDSFYKFIAKLQKERAEKCDDKDILEPDSLAF